MLSIRGFILFYDPIYKLLYIFFIRLWKEFHETTLKQREKTKTDQEFHETAFEGKKKSEREKTPNTLSNLKDLDFILRFVLQMGNSTNKTNLICFI